MHVLQAICFKQYTTDGGATSEIGNFALLQTSDWTTHVYISDMGGQKHRNMYVGGTERVNDLAKKKAPSQELYWYPDETN